MSLMSSSSPPPSSSEDQSKKHWKLFKVFSGLVVISAAAVMKIGISNSARMDEAAILRGTGIIERNETTTIEVVPAPAVEIQVDNAISSNSKPNSPSLWIHVVDWAEGMAGWRIALHELLTLARLYNATLVEPCASNGRLLSCARTEDLSPSTIADSPLRLRDMLDLPALKEHVWPKIVTLEEFVTATGYSMSYARDDDHRKTFKYNSSLTNRDDHTIFQACLCSKKRGHCRSVEPPLNTSHGQESQVAIQQAVQNSQTQTTILEIVLYREHALKNMIHSGHNFTYYTQQTHDQMKQVGFPQDALARVQSMLEESWNITRDDPFAVLQWRPELEPLDYQACATAMLQARDHISQRDGIPLNNFILVSPLSQHEELEWYGVKQLANRHKDTSYPALNRLLHQGFKKLEESSTFFVDGSGVPDGGLLAIWDFILAQTATTFSTCSGCNETRVCSQCSYQGHSVEYLLGLREQYTSGKQGVFTDTCWPESNDTIGESSQRFG